ncbi:M23 family metallopeptidase [Limnofasciculus baicalensis]|uniref:M23 family metallopeptidase n=1 Tax=Limnofasciculus baicalensis BBK-W-15 TaxID=2699891 RepID=A0AAE3GNJ4_9CYAN|nr:M23 family metallopeptidase [Limnofasciculus baicalensis]MCP2726888.1 M23 family metallopeptidase [Limnofasciculus baicalensis BBK-W-15]
MANNYPNSKEWVGLFSFPVTVYRPLFISVVAGIIISPNPVQALQVQVTPANPQLGETLSVVVQTDTTQQQPTVSMGKQTYPTFPLSTNRYRAFIPTTPLDKPGTLQIQVTGDGERKTLGVPLANRSFPTQRIRLSGSGSQDATEIELRRVDEFKKLVTPQKFWNGAFLKPSNASVSTIYGIRRYYNGVFAQDYYHRGVDYAGATGSPVVAPAAGRVSLVGRVAEGFRVHGNTVGIDHGQGVLSIMLHLSRIDVKEGDLVQAGQRIGTVGSTGASTGPHLHWGLYVNGISVDPVPWRFQGFE